MYNRATVSDEISLICTVYYSAEKSVNYRLLTWQLEYSIDPDNSNPR